MKEKKPKPAQFTIISNKIFGIGLDSYEIATFLALASHGGENAMGIFPSWARLQQMTGQSKKRLWKSLAGLKARNVLIWDRGKTGVANTYHLLGIGCWTRVDNFVAAPRRPVSLGNHPGFPGKPGVVSLGNTNHIHFNHSQLTSKNRLTPVDNLEAILERIRKRNAD